MISEASDRLQMAQEACLDSDILTSFEGFCTTAEDPNDSTELLDDLLHFKNFLYSMMFSLI